MEHIVQFSVSFDDNAIIQKVVEQATEQVVAEMLDECRRELGLNRGCYGHSVFFERMAEKVIMDCKDQIIDAASEELANRAPKQKWYRDAMSKRFSEMDSGE